MKVVKTVKLIFCEADKNSNKVWTGVLYDDGTVETTWGRVGKKLQSKRFPYKGEAYLDKKEREKRKKGYTDLHVVNETVQGNSISTSVDIAQAAKRDIRLKSPKLTELVKRLVDENVHNITSRTSIEYDDSTGLFKTPLGIITPTAIEEARDVLAKIKRYLDNERELKKLASQYLRLVPHDIGMKFRVYDIFPNADAVANELNILDSLQSSYDTVTSQTTKEVTEIKQETSVFDVELDIVLPSSILFSKIAKNIRATNKRMHNYTNKKVKNIYEICIRHMDDKFNRKLGNEVDVYHGTSGANLLSIFHSGLKISPPSTAYIVGKMFGNGVYGSETSSKAMGYTFGRWGNTSSKSGWLFICTFAMGKAYYPNTYGFSSLPKGYDSCWALPKKTGLYNDELIVYKEPQINIKYLIELV